MRAIAILAPLFAIACIPRADYATGPTGPIELTLVVDPQFTVPETLQIVEGARDWVKAAEGIAISIIVQECFATRDELLPDQRCVIPLTGEEMEETWHCVGAVGCHLPKERLITLDRVHLTLGELRLVASHEMGHALGLKDSKQKGIVMSAFIDNQVPPNCKDVAALWKHHGGVPGRCLLKGAS